ncbi:FecR domain-containing protein [Pedobacter sp. MC2016-14]|uniref:FecR family protein n=1 Tax=Pedobacter sp. MC2016-14 TaxID=2897327 RepID=UPI001E440626|nr:FecR domain-containing protein [Pedobacter sp. MC2016-14]MCD0487696.1 FecR domain-containing protein [Pedobacter sp. MC2016-14]
MQDQIFQDFILKHLNAPEDDLLTQKVNEMRSLSPEHEAYFQEISKIWESSVRTKVLFELDEQSSVKKLRSRISQHVTVSTSFSYKWLINAAALFAVVVFSFWFYTEKTAVKYLVKHTGNQIDSVFLSDGTRIIMAQNSSISYPENFKGKVREISLVKGQAFFNVKHDNEHPFVIDIAKSKVTVLGTSFNIEYSASEINVSVTTGKVAFSPNEVSSPAILTAGQAISYNYLKSNLVLQEAANANSWFTKELHFVDMPLEDVCLELEAYYKVDIDFHDTKHSAKKFNATFKNSSLDEVLSVLEETYQIEVIKRDNAITIKNK